VRGDHRVGQRVDRIPVGDVHDARGESAARRCDTCRLVETGCIEVDAGDGAPLASSLSVTSRPMGRDQSDGEEISARMRSSVRVTEIVVAASCQGCSRKPESIAAVTASSIGP